MMHFCVQVKKRKQRKMLKVQRSWRIRFVPQNPNEIFDRFVINRRICDNHVSSLHFHILSIFQRYSFSNMVYISSLWWPFCFVIPDIYSSTHQRMQKDLAESAISAAPTKRSGSSGKPKDLLLFQKLSTEWRAEKVKWRVAKFSISSKSWALLRDWQLFRRISLRRRHWRRFQR